MPRGNQTTWSYCHLGEVPEARLPTRPRSRDYPKSWFPMRKQPALPTEACRARVGGSNAQPESRCSSARFVPHPCFPPPRPQQKTKPQVVCHSRLQLSCHHLMHHAAANAKVPQASARARPREPRRAPHAKAARPPQLDNLKRRRTRVRPAGSWAVVGDCCGGRARHRGNASEKKTKLEQVRKSRNSRDRAGTTLSQNGYEWRVRRQNQKSASRSRPPPRTSTATFPTILARVQILQSSIVV